MLLTLGLGGALEAISRYLISLRVIGSLGQSGWMAILTVNVAGSLYLLSSVCLSVAAFYVGLVVVRLIAGQR